VKKSLRLSLFASLLLGATAFLRADEDPAKVLVDQLNQFLTQFPQEKAYLHVDKPFYTAGETMWFKAYVVDGITHEADSLSRVLYVDLVDAAAGKVLATRTFRLEGGHAPGAWALADTLAPGRYAVRAYTNWMRNQPEYVFRREFNLFAAGQPAPEPVQQTDRASVEFFPEGGTLVAGLENRVAFKALNALGRGTDIEGVVVANGDTVAAFQSEHLGMGRFSLPVEAGKTYTAHLKIASGQRLTVPLPPVAARGHGLGIDNLTNKDVVRVYVQNSQPQPNDPKPLFLLAHLRGQVAFVAKGSTAKKTFVANVPRKTFPDGGIATFTLFDANGQPLAERVAFIQPRNRLNVAISTDKPAYKPREAVALTVAVTDTAGKPVPNVPLSLAVTDARQVGTNPHGESLVSYLLLSSDLRGTIEQPGYYVDPANPNAAPHLDLLLMTQGWRRFTWRQIQAPGQYQKPQYLFEQGLSLTGIVRRPNQKVSEKDVRLTLLLSRGEDKQFLMEGADAEGKFGFYNLDFQDTTQILLQAVAGKNNRYLDLQLTPAPAPPTVALSRVPFAPVELTGSDFAAYQKRVAEMLDIERQSKLGKATTLKEVTVKGRKEPVFDGRKIYGQAGTSLKVDPMMSAGAMSVLDLLRGRVAGVNVTGNFPNYSVNIRGISSLTGSNEPLFLLDGVPMDLSAIVSIPVQDVEQIDVLKGAEAAIFGVRGANGAIAILTKRGNSNYDYSKDVTPGTINRKIRGYELVREFYSPDYGTDRPGHARPDYRSTLYWNPSVRTDASGKAVVRFFNSDEATGMRAVAEGLTSSGGALGVGRVEAGGK
jgi:TonB-dependent SusC/RagA subfamily outer membrane receptor